MQVASPACYYTPPQVAKRYGVDPSKIIGWIKRGELRAIDVSACPGGRPRFRISPADLALFEAARAAGPQPKVSRRRKEDPSVIQFF